MKVLEFFQNNHLPFIEKSNGLMISCFNKADHPRGDQTPSLSVHKEKGYFHCWSCKISGNFGQLMGAMGYQNDIEKYSYYKKNTTFDILTLKSKSNYSSLSLQFPGVGEFFSKKKERDELSLYLASKKITLNPDQVGISQHIINSPEFDYQSRVDFFKSNPRNIKQPDPIPEYFYKVQSLDYLTDRGLPENFCKKNDIYLSKMNADYFFIPMLNFYGGIKCFLAVCMQKKPTGPKTFYEYMGRPASASNPILGLETLNRNADVYVVEGWLDYFKLKQLEYNCFPTLSNTFNQLHYSIINSCTKNVYFVFDQDIGGYQMLKRILPYVSRHNTEWYALLLAKNYKDVGDVELLFLEEELKNANKIPLIHLKKYYLMLTMEKVHARLQDIDTDRYSFRGDSIFTEYNTEALGEGNEGNSSDSPPGGQAVYQGNRDQAHTLSFGGLVSAQRSTF